MSDLPKSSLAYLLNGERVCRQVAHIEHQPLTPVEEQAIVQYNKKLDDWGFPPGLDMMRRMARMLVGIKTEGLIEAPVGTHWIT